MIDSCTALPSLLPWHKTTPQHYFTGSTFMWQGKRPDATFPRCHPRVPPRPDATYPGHTYDACRIRFLMWQTKRPRATPLATRGGWFYQSMIEWER